ncbi:MAG TPA: hypothetical protein VFU86_06640, partial [Terriglobales bacterium]|nr:hypothetical protein [Terriglobales bacterium]
MRLRHKKSAILVVAAAFILFVPLTARAFIGTVPVIDWTAIVRIGQEIGISKGTLNTLGLYVQQYSH